MDRIVYIIFRIFCFVCSALPARAAAGLGCMIGLAFAALDSRRGRVLRHMSYAVGWRRAEGLISRYYEHLGLMAVEAGRMDKYRPDNSEEWMDWEGLDALENAVARGKGAILVVGHIGNWEILGQAVAAAGIPLHVFIKPLDNPYLDQHLEKVRDGSGMVVHRKGGGMRWIVKTLRDGHAYGLLMDQDQGSAGEFVPFFGRPASTVTTAARIARRSGAALVPVTNHRTRSKDRFCMVAGPVIDVDDIPEDENDIYAITLRCNQAIERAILAHPAQWVWAQRRWRTQPDPDPR